MKNNGKLEVGDFFRVESHDVFEIVKISPTSSVITGKNVLTQERLIFRFHKESAYYYSKISSKSYRRVLYFSDDCKKI